MNKIRDLFQKLQIFKKKSAQVDEDDAGEYLLDAEETGDTPPPQPESFDEEEYYDEEYDLEPLTLKERLTSSIQGLKDKLTNGVKRNANDEDPENSGDTKWGKDKFFGAANTAIRNIDTQKLKSFHVEIFSPARRNSIHKAFQYSIIFGSVFIVGKNLALFIKGAETVPSKSVLSAGFEGANELTRADINDMRNSGLFKTEAAKPVDDVKKPVIAEDVKCQKADRKSRLPIKLINTVVLQDSIKSIASVQVRSSSELTEVREGDKINDMAKIDLIDRQKIIVKNLKDGNCEAIENLEDTGRGKIAVMSPSQSKEFKRRSLKIEGIENKGNSFTIEKSFIQDKMKNISDVLTQARGIQLSNPDGSISFKIVDVEPGGIFSYLGIQNNDVITHINGKKISNLNEVMSLFGKISNVDKMKITVNRNGEPVPLDYSIR